CPPLLTRPITRPRDQRNSRPFPDANVLKPRSQDARPHWNRDSTPPRSRHNRWLLPGLVVDLGTRSVLLDRLDPVQRGRLALVHFTGRDDLTVGGHQVEVVLAIR